MVLTQKTHVTVRLEQKGVVKRTAVFLTPSPPVATARISTRKKTEPPDPWDHSGKQGLKQPYNHTNKPGVKSVPFRLGKAITPAALQVENKQEIPGKLPYPGPDGGGETGTPLAVVSTLSITGITLTPAQPRKNEQVTLAVAVQNKGPEEMPYACNVSVVAMTSDQFGSVGSWGEPEVMI